MSYKPINADGDDDGTELQVLNTSVVEDTEPLVPQAAPAAHPPVMQQLTL